MAQIRTGRLLLTFLVVLFLAFPAFSADEFIKYLPAETECLIHLTGWNKAREKMPYEEFERFWNERLFHPYYKLSFFPEIEEQTLPAPIR